MHVTSARPQCEEEGGRAHMHTEMPFLGFIAPRACDHSTRAALGSSFCSLFPPLSAAGEPLAAPSLPSQTSPCLLERNPEHVAGLRGGY